PVLSALGVDLHDRRLTRRVVDADLLFCLAVATRARIHDDDAVERCTDLAHAGQTNLDCHFSGVSFCVLCAQLIQDSRGVDLLEAAARTIASARLRGPGPRAKVQVSIVPEGATSCHLGRFRRSPSAGSPDRIPRPCPGRRRRRPNRPGPWSCRPSCPPADRKSTRLNSSHVSISYAVFCLLKKT